MSTSLVTCTLGTCTTSPHCATGSCAVADLRLQAVSVIGPMFCSARLRGVSAHPTCFALVVRSRLGSTERLGRRQAVTGADGPAAGLADGTATPAGRRRGTVRTSHRHSRCSPARFLWPTCSPWSAFLWIMSCHEG